MSFDIKLSFKSDKDPEKALLLSNEAGLKEYFNIAIIGPNSQQATFRIHAAELLAGLRSFFPEVINLSG